jgi:hypothetical protein
MFDLFRGLIFFIIAAIFFIGAYAVFIFFSRRLRNSSGSAAFLFNAFLLILANVVLLAGGIFAILRVYSFFYSPN